MLALVVSNSELCEVLTRSSAGLDLDGNLNGEIGLRLHLFERQLDILEEAFIAARDHMVARLVSMVRCVHESNISNDERTRSSSEFLGLLDWDSLIRELPSIATLLLSLPLRLEGLLLRILTREHLSHLVANLLLHNFGIKVNVLFLEVLTPFGHLLSKILHLLSKDALIDGGLFLSGFLGLLGLGLFSIAIESLGKHALTLPHILGLRSGFLLGFLIGAVSNDELDGLLGLVSGPLVGGTQIFII